MNSRSRVLAALNHKEPDKVPFDLGGTGITGINYEVYKNLLSILFGDEDPEVNISDRIQQLARVEERVKRVIGVDVDGIFPHSGLVVEELEEEDYDSFYDPYGIKWSMPKDGGFFYDMVEHPLEDADNPKDIEHYDWPDPRNQLVLDSIKDQISEAKGTGRAIALEANIGGLGAGIFEMGFWLRGYKNFYLDLARGGDLLEALMDKLMELRIEYWDFVLEEVGESVDIAIEADDLGTQEDVMISPSSYRDFIRPRHKRVFEFIKDKAPEPIFVFLHSDGAIYDLIPDLIEAGVDILNPVQVNAEGMKPEKLKEKFGGELVFWGGGVDSQTTLPQGTSDEVREEVSLRIDQLAQGGGFIFAPIHNIQADVPRENIETLIEAFNEFRSY